MAQDNLFFRIIQTDRHHHKSSNAVNKKDQDRFWNYIALIAHSPSLRSVRGHKILHKLVRLNKHGMIRYEDATVPSESDRRVR